ncbi:MAG: CPXCG motif-containing cysteine-rich protein [Methylococcaceae bacterium]
MHDLEEMIIDCPYCGETFDVLVDTSAGAQEYYEDCSVCCAPILVIVSEDNEGGMVIDVKRDDE